MSTLSHRRSAPLCTPRRTYLLDALDVYRQRRALARLDDQALNDIGLTREDAMAEANRPIWDICHR